MSAETADILALSLTPGAGRVTTGRVLALCRLLGRAPGELLGQPFERLVRLLPPGCLALARVLAGCTPAHRLRAEALLKTARGAGCRVLHAAHPGWPRSLCGPHAPPLLFVRGNTRLLSQRGAGVAGARKAAPESLAVARACGRFWAGQGAVLISGGCHGVDVAAHEAAVCAGGATTVVLPHGHCAWRVPGWAARALAAGRLLAISEFPPDTGFSAAAAVTRNAGISALSSVLCVAEPRRTGGSIQTARHSLALGRPVFVHGGRLPAGFSGCAPLCGAGGSLDTRALAQAWVRPEAPVQADLFTKNAPAESGGVQ
jgi:DNA processing protein